MAFLLRAISGGNNSFREKIKDAEDVNKTFQAELVCCNLFGTDPIPQC